MSTKTPRRLVIGISGASGAIYGVAHAGDAEEDRHRDASGHEQVGRDDAGLRDQLQAEGHQGAGLGGASDRRHRRVDLVRLVPHHGHGDRAVLDPHHERDRDRRDALAAVARRRRGAEGEAPAGAGDARDAAARRPSAHHGDAVRHRRGGRADRAGVLQQAEDRRRHHQPHRRPPARPVRHRDQAGQALAGRPGGGLADPVSATNSVSPLPWGERADRRRVTFWEENNGPENLRHRHEDAPPGGGQRIRRQGDGRRHRLQPRIPAHRHAILLGRGLGRQHAAAARALDPQPRHDRLPRPHGRNFQTHVRGALNNGMTPDEIRAVLIQIAVYCGIPVGVDCFRHAKPVIDAHEEVEALSLSRAHCGTKCCNAKYSGAVPNAGVRNGPGSAVHHFASLVLRCARDKLSITEDNAGPTGQARVIRRDPRPGARFPAASGAAGARRAGDADR